MSEEGERRGQGDGVMITVLLACGLLIVAIVVMVAMLLDEHRADFEKVMHAALAPRPTPPAPLPPREWISRKPLPAYAEPAIRAKPLNNPGTWLSSDDYPASAILDKKEGRTRMRIEVDASGKSVACAAAVSSGTVALDEAACRAAMTHARFSPARDAVGKAIPSIYPISVTWQLPQL